ncbi:MAG: ImmA/IrrE family metallo-endopeptidase [Candidatus Paceibacterota bacterium]|jgi:Zn-dependent peptidase ImmA (M78 family)
METKKIVSLAERMSAKFNPEGLTPFPFSRMPGMIVETDMLPYDIAGGLLFTKEGGIINIWIDRSRSEERKLYTKAHCFGHYYLHRDNIPNDGQLIVELDPDTRSYDTAVYKEKFWRTEYEADLFASALLMPARWVRKVWKELKGIGIGPCSKIFCVPFFEMTMRLKHLGLIE